MLRNMENILMRNSNKQNMQEHSIISSAELTVHSPVIQFTTHAN